LTKSPLKSIKIATQLLLVIVILMLIVPSALHLCPVLVGADGSFVVMGGSMAPTYHVGDLVFTDAVDPAEIGVGDVIAVRLDSTVYTHRVIETVKSEDGLLFRLKGDANEEPDLTYVNGSELIGKAVFSLPTGFVYSGSGYLLVVSVPLMGLAFYQSHKIYRAYTQKKRGLKARRNRRLSVIDSTSILLLLIVVVGGTYMITSRFTSVSGGFFVDAESSSSNTVGAGMWKVASSISCMFSSSKITVGEFVSISGNITPPRSALVTIEYSVDGGASWSLLAEFSSDSGGSYVYEWSPDAGSYMVRASWAGDGGYFGAVSNNVNLVVNENVEE